MVKAMDIDEKRKSPIFDIESFVIQRMQLQENIHPGLNLSGRLPGDTQYYTIRVTGYIINKSGELFKDFNYAMFVLDIHDNVISSYLSQPREGGTHIGNSIPVYASIPYPEKKHRADLLKVAIYAEGTDIMDRKSGKQRMFYILHSHQRNTIDTISPWIITSNNDIQKMTESIKKWIDALNISPESISYNPFDGM